MNFKQEMKKVLVPHLEKMIEKENNHLEKMRSKRKEISNSNRLTLSFKTNLLDTLKQIIDTSEKALNHLNKCLNEYQNYIDYENQ